MEQGDAPTKTSWVLFEREWGQGLAAAGVMGSYMKMKWRAASGESGMSVTVVGGESDGKGFWEEGEGEGRGRRQERTNEGEGHLYRFPVGRKKPCQSWIFNKFIVPELDRAFEHGGGFLAACVFTDPAIHNVHGSTLSMRG